MFFNLLLKLGEYNHTRGSAPLLIYCLLKGIRVNIPKLLINFMLSEHFMISSRYLPYGMMIVTHLLRYFKINIFSKTAYPPINIDRTHLKRIQSGTRTHAQPPPVQFLHMFASGSSSSSIDPYSALMNQMSAMSLRQSEDTTKSLANQEDLKNTLAYVCSSH